LIDLELRRGGDPAYHARGGFTGFVPLAVKTLDRELAAFT
jgi:hypothetical protein